MGCGRVLLKIDGVQLQCHRDWIAFVNLVAVVQFKARQRLPRIRTGPANIDSGNGGGVADADFLPQRI